MAKKRITKVCTKTGDDGTTSLVGGKRVKKSSPRVEAYGDVDELNAAVGVAAASVLDPRVKELLRVLQNSLFIVGSDLASPSDAEFDVPRVSEQMCDELGSLVEAFSAETGPLEEFILPGGSESSSRLHLARAVCRRAERKVEALFGGKAGRSHVLVYLNRLSDLLFVLARIENRAAGTEEVFVDFGERKNV